MANNEKKSSARMSFETFLRNEGIFEVVPDHAAERILFYVSKLDQTLETQPEDDILQPSDFEWAGELFTFEDAAEQLGQSIEDLVQLEKSKGMISLSQGSDGALIPMAQFEGNEVLDGVQEVLAAANGNSVKAWKWLVSMHDEFDEMAPIDVLEGGRIKLVAAMAEYELSREEFS